MMHSLSLLALAASATAQIRGFNYGALYADQSARLQPDWEADFRAAQNLPGGNGFTSARLFTMIQGYSQTAEIISALPAALATNTSLLLGLWCSSGDEAFQQELTALRAALEQYGEELRDLIVGISIGSEDLYRISPTGIENESGPGAQPQQLVDYIGRAREVLRGSAWAEKPIGHVDTWTAYVNGSNSEVVAALDWVGVDAYPYFQTVNENSIDNAEGLFFDAYDATVGAAQGKPVWVTETGWPVTGPQSGQATSGTTNAETYWKNVACRLFSQSSTNVWWYQLNDGAEQEVSFRVIPPSRGAPLYDLSCQGVDTSSRSTNGTSASRESASSSGSGSASTQGVGSASDGRQQAGQQAGASASGSSGSGSTSSGSTSSGSGSGSSSGSGAPYDTKNSTGSHSTPSGMPSAVPYTGAAVSNAANVIALLVVAAGFTLL